MNVAGSKSKRSFQGSLTYRNLLNFHKKPEKATATTTKQKPQQQQKTPNNRKTKIKQKPHEIYICAKEIRILHSPCTEVASI